MATRKRGAAHQGSDLDPPPKTWLNRRRRERAVSQNELSTTTGISARTLSRLENGEVANPPLRYLVNCAKALGIDDWRDLVEDEWEEWLALSHATRRPKRARTTPFLERP
jgi:transcriptional regulator with XRE-family HTH domain